MNKLPRRSPSISRALVGCFVLVLSLAATLHGVRDGFAGSTTALRPQAIQSDAAPKEIPLSAAKAVVLGLVEGITEFLPISSTGHLLVAERLLDVGTQSDDAKKAADAYAVIIQLGAIAAVLLISWRRVLDVLQGVVGRSETGRRLLFNLLAAFVPAATVGVLFDSVLEENLLKPVPVAIAWIVGGVAILGLSRRLAASNTSGRLLDAMTPRHALIIGVAQALALWPGVSRSLVTIVAAILLGFRVSDAVEFSFLLGLCTLSAAAGYSLLKDGSLVFDTFGTGTPLIGMLVAFVSAAVAVKWMVAYLNKRDLSIFGIYRVVVGVATLVLVATNALN